MADVLFVDYGNTSSVPVESLKLLSQKHLDMPPFAIRCKLNGIASNGESWTQASIDAFLDMVDELLLGITFISKDVPATINISKDDKDVAQSLIEMELAIVETCPETEEAYADDHLVAVEDQLHSLPTDLSYPKRKIRSTRLPVKIGYVDAYDKFYVMPLELTTELDTVMKTLELLYRDESENGSKEGVPSYLEDPIPSLPCVAKYSEDEAWYRALITDVSKSDISVSFVDYGNSEITSLENLKPLTPELIKIPPIAIECKLYGIKATEGREQEISAKLEELYVEEIELEMEIVIKKELYEIKLFHEGDMAEALCNKGLAFEVVASHDDLIETLSEVVVAANLESEFAEVPEEQVSGIPQQDLSSKEQVTVSVKFCEVEDSMVVLYGVPIELDEELTELQAALEASYSETERKVSQVKCNDVCAANYHEDETWYRVRVVDCTGEKVKVKFIDYGNSDEVDKDSINELLPEFMTKPQFSLKLCLTGFKVAEEKEPDVQAKLDENVYEDSVVVQLCKYTHKSPNICITDMTCGDVNLLESLQSEKYLSQCYVKYFDIEDKFDGTVEHIAEDLFYVLPVKLVEMRDLLTVDLKSECCDTSCDTSVDPAYLYAAEINGSWSRVSISEMDNSAESALVKVVDFGFETNVPLSLLKRLSIEMCHRPVALLPCRIANVDQAPLTIQNKEVEKVRGVVFHCEVQQDVTDSNVLSVNLFQKTSNVSEEDSQILEENQNTVADSEATKPVEDSEDLQNDQNENTQETNSLIEPSQELDQNLNDSQYSEVNEKPRSEDLESDSNPVNTESQQLSHDETIACHGFSDPGARDIEVPIVENGYEVSNDSDVESKEVEMIEVDACKKAQQLISVLSESDASLNCAIAATGETEECKDVGELQDSEAEDNYDGANDEEESEVLVSRPEGVVEAISGDSVAVQAVEDEWDERPECDIKEESLLEQREESLLEEESFLEEREESLLEEREGQLKEKEESLFVEKEESLLEEREESLLEESESDSPLFSERKPGNADPTSSTPSKPKEDLSSESNDILTSPDNVAKDEDSEVVDPAEQSPKADGNLKSETPVHSIIADEKVAKESDFKYVPDDVLVVDPAELSFSNLENESPNSHIDKENNQGNASQEESKFTPEDPETIKSADLSKPETGLETESDSHPVDENMLNSSDILDSKSTTEEAEVVDSTELSLSKPESDLDFEEVPEEESIFSIDPALLRLSGKMDVYVRDVAISNGSIILAVTSYPCYLELEKKLHHQFQKVYSEKEPGLSESSKLCAVLCNDTWYRGKILELSDEEVTVLLIDYGTCKTVPISAAKELTPCHKDIPPFVAWCTLTHLFCPEEKCNDTKEYLDSVLANIQDTGKIVSVEVIEEEEPYKVILFHNEDSISYNLLTENLVVQQLPETYVASGAYKAKLSHAGQDKDKVYVNLDTNFDDIKTLKISMECSYPIEGLKASELQLNMFYAVLHNGEWMRGKAVSSDEEIVLQLIDTGEVLPAKSHVFPLLPLHCLQPPYAILCELGSEVTKSEKLVQALGKEEFKVTIECNLDSSKCLTAKIEDEGLIERLSSQDQ